MKTILVIGAGRSTSYLIKYLLDNAAKEQWMVRVGDMSLELASQKVSNHPCAHAFTFDVNNEDQRIQEITQADIVISMLPATMHMQVAKACLHFKKHLVTASYISNEMRTLHDEAKQAGVILLNECGLDPGIDHASAMKVIDKIHHEQGELTLFKSYCGGLIAPESNDNPWGYKFSWNPKNVVLAGQGTSKYIENGKYKYIPYNRLFIQTEKIQTKINNTILNLEAYANRDSLSYRTTYNIPNIATMLRGTLRFEGYCKAWNVFVKLGLTDDNCMIEPINGLTYKQLIDSYLPLKSNITKENLFAFMGDDMDDETFSKIEWLGILSNKEVNFNKYNQKAVSVAQLLLDLLEEKWLLQNTDKDMVVMQHHFEYVNKEKHAKKIISSLLVKGMDQTYTAMAKTVGLPLAIATKLILQEKIKARGVLLPTIEEIYLPLLAELETFDICFEEQEQLL
jgi:saccharopine dehydrogenase-like NADP-dependent oxidoreductase